MPGSARASWTYAGGLPLNRNTANLVVELRPANHFTRATQSAELTDDAFDIPTTIARHGNRLYVINARFGQETPTTTYDVVKVG